MSVLIVEKQLAQTSSYFFCSISSKNGRVGGTDNLSIFIKFIIFEFVKNIHSSL